MTDADAHNHHDAYQPKAEFRRGLYGLAAAIFVSVFATPLRLAKFPLRAYLKDELGLTPEGVAGFFALAGLAWYLKPVAGVLSDQVRLRGTRRKHYLMLSSLGGALMWTIPTLAPTSFELLLVWAVLLNVAAVLGNSVAGGLLVEQARRHGATGRLSAVRVGVMNFAALIAGPLGGWLAGRAFPITCGLGVLLMLGMCVVVWRLLPPDQLADVRPLQQRLVGVVAQLRERRLWSVMLLVGAFHAVPAYYTLFYFYQREALAFSDQTIGLLAAVNCAGGMAGAAAYAVVGRKLALGRKLVLGLLLYAGCTSAYFAYDSLRAALMIEPILGFCFVLGVMPLNELVARASPPQHEAFGFAVLMSVGNAALSVADVAGTQIADAFALDVHAILVVNIVATVASSTLLVLVPRALLGREREASAGARL